MCSQFYKIVVKTKDRQQRPSLCFQVSRMLFLWTKEYKKPSLNKNHIFRSPWLNKKEFVDNPERPKCYFNYIKLSIFYVINSRNKCIFDFYLNLNH